jgi:hypothetical protein
MAFNEHNIHYEPISDSDSDSTYEIDTGIGYELAYCELHNPQFHGGNYDNEDDKLMCGKYLYINKVRPLFPSNNSNIQRGYRNTNLINELRYMRRNNVITNVYHPTIRNYSNIICKRDYRNAQIVQRIRGPGPYSSAVIKTHYLRLLQRKWKRIYAEKQRLIALRKNPRAIRFRELNGCWSKL